jgi:hypothetical protein
VVWVRFAITVTAVWEKAAHFFASVEAEIYVYICSIISSTTLVSDSHIAARIKNPDKQPNA